MKKKIINFMVIFSLMILLLEILLNKRLVFDTISYSLHVWTNSLIPTMFPFFVISDILISFHITNYIPFILKKTFCKLFHVSDCVVTIFFLSCISGFPSNARNTRNFWEQKLISSEEASHALMFTHFANPLFVLSTVGVFFFRSETYGYLILISHYLGNLFIGILTRKMNIPSKFYYTLEEDKCQSFSTTFIRAIRSSIDTLFLILGTLTCFLIVSSLLIEKLNLNLYHATFLKGILEITMGLESLPKIGVPLISQVVVATMFLSFGGFSVHLQVLSQLVDTDISYQYFFVARIFHALFSGGICYLLFLIFI